MTGNRERRSVERVSFERGYDVQIMAIDGTWRRNCSIQEVSESGARLLVDGSLHGLNLSEFFLLLSTVGVAYRRCELNWVDGVQMGVSFLKQKKKKDPATKR